MDPFLIHGLLMAVAWLALRQIGASVFLQALPWAAALVFLVLFRRFARQGRWIDTYEAIWGPQPSPSSQTRMQTNEEPEGREPDAT